MKLPKVVRVSIGAVFVSVGLAGLCLMPASATPSSGGVGGRPANPDPTNPRTQSIFIYNLERAQTKSDQVIVSNNSDESQIINLYAVDGVVSNTGAYTCEQQAEVPQGVGSWLKLSTDQVTLAAHENKKVDFTFSVPATADVGEHDGCLVFQSATDQGQMSGNVRILTRQAIRVIETVPGTLHRSISIEQFSVEQKKDTQTFALTIGNTGNVSADVDAEVTLRNIFNHQVYQNGGGYPVLANKKLSLNFVNDKRLFFGGWYTAQATVSYDSRPGTFGTADASHLLTERSKQITIFITPQPLAILLYSVVLVMVFGALGWVILRRRERVTAQRIWHTKTIAPGDTIASLAQEYHVSWKKIAAINHLLAPYTLTVGDTIKLPNIPDATSDPHSIKDR